MQQFRGLVKLCRCCTSDQTKDGMRTVAWNTLIKAHSLERDTRVLEALKVGQVVYTILLVYYVWDIVSLCTSSETGLYNSPDHSI